MHTHTHPSCSVCRVAVQGPPDSLLVRRATTRAVLFGSFFGTTQDNENAENHTMRWDWLEPVPRTLCTHNTDEQIVRDQHKRRQWRRSSNSMQSERRPESTCNAMHDVGRQAARVEQKKYEVDGIFGSFRCFETARTIAARPTKLEDSCLPREGWGKMSKRGGEALQP